MKKLCHSSPSMLITNSPSHLIFYIVGLSGFLPLHPMTYIDAKRNRLKAVKEEAERMAELDQPQSQEAAS